MKKRLQSLMKRKKKIKAIRSADNFYIEKQLNKAHILYVIPFRALGLLGPMSQGQRKEGSR